MTTSLLDLPSELLILVALELTPKDLGALARVRLSSASVPTTLKHRLTDKLGVDPRPRSRLLMAAPPPRALPRVCPRRLSFSCLQRLALP